MNWLPLALATAVAFGLYNIFIKMSSGRIDQILGALILQLIAAACGGLFLLYLRLAGRASFDVTPAGFGFAVLAGVAVGVAEILTFIVFSRGAPASLGSPIIMGGSVLVAALIGIAFLREAIGLVQVAGILSVVAGIALISAGAR